jgi:hypothetical protein
MKKIFILLILTFCSFKLFAQDLIITDYGDSILCKITIVTLENIDFRWKQNNEFSSMTLPLSRVKKYTFNFFPESKIPPEKKFHEREFKSLQLSLDGGLSFAIGKLEESIPDNLKSYYQDLKSGYNIGAGISYYLDGIFGIGLNYKCFLSSNYLNNAYFQSFSGYMTYGVLSDHLKISFYAPSFTLRTLKGHSPGTFYSNYYIGYIRYHDDIIKAGNYKITGNTIGLGMDAGYDFELFENFLVGFQASLIAGGIHKFILDDGKSVQTITLEKGSYESLYRIDLSIGLRLKL